MASAPLVETVSEDAHFLTAAGCVGAPITAWGMSAYETLRRCVAGFHVRKPRHFG